VAGVGHDLSHWTLKEKGVELLEEGELIELSDLIKVKVFDDEKVHIGHLQDLAIDDDLESSFVSYLGVHLLWMDRVGEVELVRPVEDIVLLLPWSQVAGIDEDVIHLEGVHPDFPIETARGKTLIRRDVLNKQILDEAGNRIQRVDDVLLEREGKTLKLAGLKVATGWFSSGSSMQGMLDRLRSRHDSRHDVEMIPWEAVLRVDDNGIIIATE
jgi:sporulation protein YlmC with PRC-barrel domain